MNHEGVNVVAVVATYQRDECLDRLIGALNKQKIPLRALVVADNADSGGTRNLVLKQTNLSTEYIALPQNPGCGAGLAAAMRRAHEFWGEDLYFFVCDDDAVPEPDALDKLLRVLREDGALAVAPMLVGAKGLRDGGPEVCDAKLHAELKKLRRPDEVRQYLQGQHPEFIWCRGPSMLLSPDAVARYGFHRGDMWMLGEDIEYSMRLSYHGKCLFVPEATVHHLPPASSEVRLDDTRHQVKFLAMLQNLAFMGAHLSHTRKCLFYLPGHIFRYLRTFRNRQSLTFLVRALWNGMFGSEPAGLESGIKLRRKLWSEI